MKTFGLVVSLLFLPTLIIGQEKFPEIQVTDLNDKSINIPQDTEGKFTLIGIAFSQDAQNDLYSWSQPVQW